MKICHFNRTYFEKQLIKLVKKYDRLYLYDKVYHIGKAKIYILHYYFKGKGGTIKFSATRKTEKKLINIFLKRLEIFLNVS